MNTNSSAVAEAVRRYFNISEGFDFTAGEGSDWEDDLAAETAERIMKDRVKEESAQAIADLVDGKLIPLGVGLTPAGMLEPMDPLVDRQGNMHYLCRYDSQRMGYNAAGMRTECYSAVEIEKDRGVVGEMVRQGIGKEPGDGKLIICGWWRGMKVVQFQWLPDDGMPSRMRYIVCTDPVKW